MLSDEVLRYFAEKGYQTPAYGTALVKMNRRPEQCELWQITLYSAEKKHHIFETSFSAVEVVAKMIMRLSKTVEESFDKETGQLEVLSVAFSALIVTLADISNRLENQ